MKILLSNKRSKEEIKEIVMFVRRDLYNNLKYCGAKAIIEEMKSLDVEPLPSLSTINRILRDNYLTHRRMGYSSEDYKNDLLHYINQYGDKRKRMGGTIFLKLEEAYRATSKAIFSMISNIKRFMKYLWKKEDFMI